jgi:TIR domain
LITHPRGRFGVHDSSVSRVLVSHSSRDSIEALALKTWLERAEPGLVGEVVVDLDPDTGIPAEVRWNEALRRANDRCEAVICLVSKLGDASHECRAEYCPAEDRGKPIFPVRLEPTAGRDTTSEWQRCDLFGDGPKTVIEVDGGTESVEFLTAGLVRLQKGLRAAGIAPDTFASPPEGEPDRASYRGWQPLEAVGAAVYFGRDAEINRALTAIRELRTSGDQKLFVILGPSGVRKSPFLRAGVLPRLRRDDRHFLADWWPVDCYVPKTVRKAPITSSVTMRWSSSPFPRPGASKRTSWACSGSAAERCSSCLLCGDRVADLAAATADGSPRAGVTSHSTRIHLLSVGTRVLGRGHAATVHFLCPREQA